MFLLYLQCYYQELFFDSLNQGLIFQPRRCFIFSSQIDEFFNQTAFFSDLRYSKAFFFAFAVSAHDVFAYDADPAGYGTGS